MKKRPSEKTLGAMRNSRASMEISGFTVTEEDEALILSFMHGEMTHEEFLKLAKEKATNSQKTNSGT